EPVGRAFQSIGHICFRPFDIGKWFIMGFSAFLAGFVEGGFSFPGLNFAGQGGGPGGGGDVQDVLDWLRGNLTLVLLIALTVLALIIALSALFTWLGSRGQFMFIDNLVRNRGAVVAPWHEFRAEGNSAFWFRFLFNLAVLVALAVVISGAILLAWEDIQAEHFGGGAATALVVGIGGALLLALVAAVVGLFLTDFVVPI